MRRLICAFAVRIWHKIHFLMAWLICCRYSIEFLLLYKWRIWYLSPMRAAKVQASLHICAVSPEPSLLAHTNSESSETFRQKARSLAPLNGWACAVKICHDGMLEDTNSLDGAQIMENCRKLSLNYHPAPTLPVSLRMCHNIHLVGL